MSTVNKIIETGNFDSSIHSSKKWCDAFGNEVVAPEGYKLIRGEPIQHGDIHFDIYTGWVYGGGEAYHADRGHWAFSEGRWVAWARKI